MEGWIAVFLFGMGMGAYGLITIFVQKHRTGNQEAERGGVSARIASRR